MKAILTTFPLLILLNSYCYSQKNAALPVERGGYEMGLQICYDSASGEVSGLISFDNSDEGNGPKISCKLYFTGYHKLSNANLNEYFIQSRYPDDTTSETLSAGIIRIEKNGIFLQVKEPLSCQNLIDLKQGLDFKFEKPGDFIACRMIKSPKSFFYSAPEDSSKQRAYLVKNDPVFIREIKDGWLSIAYLSKKGFRYGWIKEQTIRPPLLRDTLIDKMTPW